jgi:hypothetical protein
MTNDITDPVYFISTKKVMKSRIEQKMINKTTTIIKKKNKAKMYKKKILTKYTINNQVGST